MKYIKIKLENQKNIIYLNEQFKEQKFSLDYCFPFFRLVLLKLIYINQNYFSINYQNLSGSAVGSFFEEKLKRSILYDNCLNANFILRYVWKFSPLEETDRTIEQYDYNNFQKIEFDENIKDINLKCLNYYIIPGNQITKSLDAALLIIGSENTYKLVTLQITKKKYSEIKEKKEYIESSFEAKEKFELLYHITISNVYFFFVLSNEFNNDETIKVLNKKEIPYLLFSFKDNKLFQIKEEKKKIILVDNLMAANAEIEKNIDKEDEPLENKLENIYKLEYYLMKKRKKENILISRNNYENGRKLIFQKDKGLKLNNMERNNIIQRIKDLKLIKDNNITIKYVFNIKIKELFKLADYNDLLGLFYFNNKLFLYHYHALILVDKNQSLNYNYEDDLRTIIFVATKKDNINKSDRYVHSKESLKLSDLKNKREIYVFKIFNLL